VLKRVFHLGRLSSISNVEANLNFSQSISFAGRTSAEEAAGLVESGAPAPVNAEMSE
jgi:hypothetical protein